MNKIIFALLVTGIVIAHIFLWRSGMETGLKLAFTLINAVAWSIVLLPILFVDKWLVTLRKTNSETRDPDNLT